MGIYNHRDYNNSRGRCELKLLERLYLEIKSVDYNEVYIATMQPELHEKYRKKTKELNIEE